MAVTIKQENRTNRLEFLNQQEMEVNSLIAQLVLSANRISAVPLAFGTDNEMDLIRELLRVIEIERGPMYEALVRSSGSMIGLGINQSVRGVNRRSGLDVSKYLSNTRQILDDFINSTFDDGSRLSDKLWTPDDKLAIIEQVRESKASGESAGQLADRINNAIKTGAPRYTIDRIANTELVRAYSRARTATMRGIQEEFGDQLQVYVRVSLSAMHPKPDICDALVGVYPLGKAPIPPHHPNCICLYEEILKPAGKQVNSTTIQDSLSRNAKFLSDNKINVLSALKLVEIA